MTEIVTWNVNGIRAAVRNGFLAWLNNTTADIVCIQEVRAFPGELDDTILKPDGFTSFWQPGKKKGYSGTATFVRKEPLSVSSMGIDAFDNEGRVQTIEYKTFSVVNAYFPNSQPERARIDYKLAFCNAIAKYCNRLRNSGHNVVLCGDYNIAHTEIDLARPKDNQDNPGFLPEERDAMTRFLAQGYVDVFRHFTREPGHYTWWSYRANARQKNIGWRLDYHCVNKEMLKRVKACVIHPQVTGSDHCPVSIALK